MSVTEREPIIRPQQYFRCPTHSQASDPSGSSEDLSKAELGCNSIQTPSIHLPTRDRPPDRKGLFGPLLDALHDSRRQQASRAIHQYRHLIAAPRSVKAGAGSNFEQLKGRTKMTTSDDANNRQNGHSTKVLTWSLIAACIIGFGILHIAGGAIINGTIKPTKEMPPVARYGD